MASPHQFKLTLAADPNHPTQPAVNTGDGSDPQLLQELATALQGGQVVTDYFSGDLELVQGFYQTIATSDDTVWFDGTDANGNPMKYVVSGDNFFSIYTQITDKTVLQNGTEDTTTYKAAGIAAVVLNKGSNVPDTILTIHNIEYAGEGIGGALTGPVLINILKFACQSVKNYVVNLAKGAFRSPSDLPPDEAEEQAEQVERDSAEEAGTEGADLGEGIAADFAVSSASVAAAGVGVFLILFMVFLQMIGKSINNFGKFYNLTAEDIQYGIGLLMAGEAHKGPAPIGQTATVAKVALGPAPPRSTTQDYAVTYSETWAINTSPLTIIGYVLQALPNPDTGFPGFRVAVYVDGDQNGLACALSTGDLTQFYYQYFTVNGDGDIPLSSQVLTTSAISGNYTLQVACNQIKGESPSPLDGTNGYNFEHLIVLTDGSMNLPNP